MPKRRIARKHDGIVTYSNEPAKLRIGTRKNGKSANTMSDKKLELVLEGSIHKKDHKNAQTVLNNRKDK